MAARDNRSPYVDYQSAAARYQRGRSLGDDVMARWTDAVRGNLPKQPSVVVDLGAGTGIFAPMWRELGATVVAVEPSPAMIDVGRETTGAAASYVRSVAESLPIAAGSVDAVWISTAIHHFADLPRTASEVARVLKADGRVLIRGSVAGLTKWPGYELFPPAARAKAQSRYPSLGGLCELFAIEGFGLVGVEHVLDREGRFGETAAWIERMRLSDTNLTAMTDDEISAAVATLRARPDEPDRLELSLVTFARA